MLAGFKVLSLTKNVYFADQNIKKIEDPWNGILKLLECKNEINQQIELKE